MISFKGTVARVLERDTPGWWEIHAYLRRTENGLKMVNCLNKCFVEREVTGLSQVLAETKDKFFGPSSALPDRNSRGLVIQDVALGY